MYPFLFKLLEELLFGLRLLEVVAEVLLDMPAGSRPSRCLEANAIIHFKRVNNYRLWLMRIWTLLK